MKIIITGSTGMVGKSVLLEGLEDDRITEILLINRNSVNLTHPKVKELLLNDFSNFSSIQNALVGYDALFHCMGVSAVGMSEQDYNKFTYEYTQSIVDTAYHANPRMLVNYVSGTGTDSSEKGRVMWARVKGKTENYILSKGFKEVYLIRLGGLIPEKGIVSKTGWYNTMYTIMRPFFPLMKKSKHLISTTNLGKALLNTLFYPQELKYLENKDLNKLATRN
ncbi:MAG: NAD-dependent epimerase/dehydratase family protein [Flavobacteriales bacterium]|jgi:nucleoside-diphosphate-sugar epimerase|nr:NAD-dependent epimerase/dehydratase family protein [Flavobacteriales bacterium]